MIHVHATIELHPGKRDEFLAEFHKLVPLVLAEDGCIDYGPTIDFETVIPAQPPVRDNVVVVVEKWENVETLEAHLMAPHMLDFRGRVGECISNMDLHVLQPA